MDMEHKSSGHATTLLAGAVIGGVLALMYAPGPGEETRRLLKSKAEQAREEAREVAEHARRAAEEKAHRFGVTGIEDRTVTGRHMDNKTLGIGLMAGTLIGAAVGLLYAPRPGKETRDLLKTKAEQTAEEALEAAEHARDLASERVRKAKAGVAAAKRDAEGEAGGSES